MRQHFFVININFIKCYCSYINYVYDRIRTNLAFLIEILSDNLNQILPFMRSLKPSSFPLS